MATQVAFGEKTEIKHSVTWTKPGQIFILIPLPVLGSVFAKGTPQANKAAALLQRQQLGGSRPFTSYLPGY